MSEYLFNDLEAQARRAWEANPIAKSFSIIPEAERRPVLRGTYGFRVTFKAGANVKDQVDNLVTTIAKHCGSRVRCTEVRVLAALDNRMAMVHAGPAGLDQEALDRWLQRMADGR